VNEEASPSTNRAPSVDGRFLLFADILGTKSLYTAKPPKAELLQRRRNSLGHSVRTAVFPYFNDANRNQFEISIFSDTVLIASVNATALAEAASHLYFTFAQYGLHAESTDQIRLLRGGMSFGQKLVATAITGAKGVSVAEIFDTGLALAYELEGIRKGSRIFISEEVATTLRETGSPYCQTWKSITGIGRPLSPAHEFLWPAIILAESAVAFSAFLSSLFKLWLRLFKTRTIWSVTEYDDTMYQVDETMKVCIRAAAFADRRSVKLVWSTLNEHLPTTDPSLADLDIRFTWGTWFQVMWVMIQLQKRHRGFMSGARLSVLLRKNIEVIVAKDYLGTLGSELLSPDWRPFAAALRELRALD
jgi:hypothetical protein